MKPADKPSFAEMLTVLGAVFSRPVDQATIQGYWISLMDLDVDAVRAAGAELMKTAKHFPRPVEFRDICDGSNKAKAGDAWEEVTKLVTNSRAAKHSDPVAEAVVKQLGGWRTLGGMDDDQLHVWARKQFLELYTEQAKRSPVLELGAGSVAELVGKIADQKALT